MWYSPTVVVAKLRNLLRRRAVSVTVRHDPLTAIEAMRKSAPKRSSSLLPQDIARGAAGQGNVAAQRLAKVDTEDPASRGYANW